MGNSADRDELIRRAADYRARVESIRSDATLSALGKRRQLERLYGETKPAVDALRQRTGCEEHTSRQELERRLFGLPRGASSADVISFRDATDRVAAIRRPEELAELMERAATSGDDMLLRAAAGHAWQQGRHALASTE
jgi:hypothetical protein